MGGQVQPLTMELREERQQLQRETLSLLVALVVMVPALQIKVLVEEVQQALTVQVGVELLETLLMGAREEQETTEAEGLGARVAFQLLERLVPLTSQVAGVEVAVMATLMVVMLGVLVLVAVVQVMVEQTQVRGGQEHVSSHGYIPQQYLKHLLHQAHGLSLPELQA